MHDLDATYERESHRAGLLERLVRCFVVSLGTTALSSAILVALAIGVGVSAGPANLVAFSCGIPVSYAANRRWVWKRRGPSDVLREDGPFWVLSVAGLVISTITVGMVGALSSSWSAPVRAVLLPLSSAGSLAVLWVIQFVLLDRLVFARAHRPRDASRIDGPRADAGHWLPPDGHDGRMLSCAGASRSGDDGEHGAHFAASAAQRR